MTKRTRISLISLSVGLVAALAGLCWQTGAALSAARLDLEYGYRRALNDLTDHVAGLTSTLEKAPYVGGGVMQSQVSMKLLEQSGAAKASLSALPLSEEKSEKLSRFLSQTGDYALYLSRRSAAGLDRDDAAPEALNTLHDYAQKLSQALQSAQSRWDTDLSSLDSLPVLDDDLDEVAQAFSQFPSLLYDGPFSDHISRRTPLYLEGAGDLTRDRAAEKAAAFLGCRAADLDYLGPGGRELPVYSFSRDDSYVNITKQGGQVAYFKKAGAFEDEALTEEEAIEFAREALRQQGVNSFRESYYVKNDNMCTINFAGTTFLDGKEVLCYPDLIKVVIELGEGATVEYDAAGYLMNRHERQLSTPALSAEEAAQSVSPLLTPQGDPTLAIIPTPGLDEVLCWEFRCRTEGAAGEEELLVYVNAETGQEEQLYLLQKDDHGTLVS